MTSSSPTHTILVIEDERSLLHAIQTKLERSHFHVVTARSIDDAINCLKGSATDIIWLDHYLLGKETGLDLIALLKKHPAWKGIPVFVVSNTASPEKVQSYMQLGVTKFYTKADYRLDVIIQDIDSYLHQHSHATT